MRPNASCGSASAWIACAGRSGRSVAIRRQVDPQPAPRGAHPAADQPVRVEQLGQAPGLALRQRPRRQLQGLQRLEDPLAVQHPQPGTLGEGPGAASPAGPTRPRRGPVTAGLVGERQQRHGVTCRRRGLDGRRRLLDRVPGPAGRPSSRARPDPRSPTRPRGPDAIGTAWRGDPPRSSSSAAGVRIPAVRFALQAAPDDRGEMPRHLDFGRGQIPRGAGEPLRERLRRRSRPRRAARRSASRRS